MYIKCWGARGSIPVSGQEYIRYGGNTTCIEVRSEQGDIIIIDAGTGIRKLGTKLLEEKNKTFNFLFTHVHWDHIIGFPFFKPLYDADTQLNIFACSFTDSDIGEIITATMKPPQSPIIPEYIKAHLNYKQICLKVLSIGSINITPVFLNHPNRGMGYKFEENGKIFVFLTDNELGFQHDGGLSFDEYVDFCKNADVLIHDAEYTEEEYKKRKGWGHSTYLEATKLAEKAEVKLLGLFHHNQERNDHEIDGIERKCCDYLRAQNVSPQCIAIYECMEIKL